MFIVLIYMQFAVFQRKISRKHETFSAMKLCVIVVCVWAAIQTDVNSRYLLVEVDEDAGKH